MIEHPEILATTRVVAGICVVLVIACIGALIRKRVIARWGRFLIVAVVCILSVFPVYYVLDARAKVVYADDAWHYFRKLCDERSGEKVYKSYRDVRSVVVVKPLQMATEMDSYDQHWYGDPYSAEIHSQRGVLESAILAMPNAPIANGRIGRGFDFVEVIWSTTKGASKRANEKISYPDGAQRYWKENIGQPVSRFAIGWEDISSPEDRRYWVAGSRLVVVDQLDNSVVAERIGFFIEAGFGSTAGQRKPWMASKGRETTCPYSHTWSDRWFLLKVLNPN